MKRITSRTLAFAFVAVVIISGRSLVGRATQSELASGVLAALLTEVRGLRTALEQMATAGPRVQLALGRLQLQEQRIVTLVRRLEDVRSNLAQSRKQYDEAARLVKDLSEGLEQEPNNPDFQRDRGTQIKQAKNELARVGAEVQRFSVEEAALMQDIGSEQNRWSDFNQRLEELDRVLGRR